MKKSALYLFMGLLAMILYTGCVVSLGGGGKTNPPCPNQPPPVGRQMIAPTVGQQLIDLQKAREAGAISEQEYQEQRAKLLGTK